MVDYQAIKALDAVIEFQSFALAAKKLSISQSAVSQRIATIENFYGTSLLIRENPYRPTELGEKLIFHLRQVQLMETDFLNWTDDFASSHPVRIAINRDSLDLWFEKVFKELTRTGVAFEIIADDENKTFDYLNRGVAHFAISCHDKPHAGCDIHHLGHMDYQMVASPSFFERNFSRGIEVARLASIQAITFDKNDVGHEKYLREFFDYHGTVPYSFCPYRKSFLHAIVQGYGYGLLPVLNLKEKIESQKIVKIDPNNKRSIDLYLHCWKIQSQIPQLIRDAIISAAQEKLG